MYKGILRDKAHGVFNGKIFVSARRPQDRREADE